MLRTSTSRLIAGLTNHHHHHHQRNSSRLRLLSTIQQQQQHQQQQQQHDNNNNTSVQSQFPHELGFVKNSPYTHILMPNTTLDQFVWNSYGKWENKIAAVCGITGRKYTYAQMRDNSAALAVRLQNKLKLKLNDVCAICLPNTPEFPISILGCIEAGCKVTTVNPIYTAEEIARQLTDSDAKILIGPVSNYQILLDSVQLTKRPIKIVCVRTEATDTIPKGTIDFTQLIDSTNIDFSSLQRYDINPNDVSLLPYSSGTTGMPKGVELTHNNITSNCLMLQSTLINVPTDGRVNNSPLINETTGDYQDVLPCVLPFFHIYGLTVTLISKLALGTKIVTLPKFTPDSFLNALDEHKGTVLHLVPPIVIFLGNYDKVEKKHVESIRCIMSGAAPLGVLDAERFTAKAPGVEFLQGYGMTETSPVVLMSSFGSKNYGAVGEPTAMSQAKIVDLNDKTNTGVGPNKTGELLVRGPQVMKGYHNNKQATDEILLADGWLKTGDICYYDDNNQFYITDRLKELIKVKGFQVPPAELEEVLRAHNKIADAAVIGVPHPLSGEVPRAFVVVKQNCDDLTEKEIQEFVASKVAVYKRLDGGVQFLKAIPKNASGKIMRRQLKDEYC